MALNLVLASLAILLVIVAVTSKVTSRYTAPRFPHLIYYRI